MSRQTTSHMVSALTMQANKATIAYEGYVQMVHGHDFPEDLAQANLQFDPNVQMNARDAKEWAEATPRQVVAGLCRPLHFVMQAALAATGTSNDYDKEHPFQPNGRESLVTTYLTQIVGPLAMKNIMREEWVGKNPQLLRLGNPFGHQEVREFFWRRLQQTRPRPFESSKLPAYELIVPGYKTPDSEATYSDLSSS